MDLKILSDSQTARLNGEELALGARAFDVLAYLHSNSERVVSKAELLDAVWEGLVVEEGNLSVQISTLRKALGKEAIKTVPGIGYRLTSGGLNNRKPPPGPKLPSIPSLVVLPFANLTGQVEQDYLVDGIVHEISNALSRVSGIFLISSTSSFTYKGRSVDLAEVGSELGVRYVLEGSIQAANNRIKIFTQLVEAESGHTIWQDRFDGTIEDIFDLQDVVAGRVAGALEPKLQYAEAARATSKPTENLKAYDLCLRALPLVFKMHAPEALEKGMEHLRQALELDPDYIQAHALVAYAHTSAFATRWWTLEQARAAIPHARKVLDSSTDDSLALAYAGHYIAYVDHQYQEGLTALQRAEMLNPNSGTTAMLLGWVYVYLDENERAIEYLERAKRLSPLHPHIAVINSGIGSAYFQMEQPEQAIVFFEQAVTEYPEFATNQILLLGCYWQLGRKSDAMRSAEWLRRKVPDMTVQTFVKDRPQHSDTHREIMAAALRETGFPD